MERQSQRILHIEPECTMGWFIEKSDVGQLHGPGKRGSRRAARAGRTEHARAPGSERKAQAQGTQPVPGRCFGLKIQRERSPDNVFHDLLTQWRRETSIHISIKLVVNTLRQRQSNMGKQRRLSPAGRGGTRNAL